MSIECFASGHHSWIRSVNVANACSTEQSTVTERLIASVSVACVLMPFLLSSSAIALKAARASLQKSSK